MNALYHINVAVGSGNETYATIPQHAFLTDGCIRQQFGIIKNTSTYPRILGLK